MATIDGDTKQSAASINNWSSDLILRVLEYLPYKDGNQLSLASRRYYYLLQKYRSFLGTELVAATSFVPNVRTRQRSHREVVHAALDSLRTTPTVAFAFSNLQGTAFIDKLPRYLPKNCIVLGSISSSIQSSLPGQLECESNYSLFLGNFGSSHLKPFQLNTREELSHFILELKQRDDWKAFIIYGGGRHAGASVDEDEVVQTLQAEYPEAVIVGGICSGGKLTLPITNPPEENDLVLMSARDLLVTIENLGGGQPKSLQKSVLIENAFRLYRERQVILTDTSNAGAFGIAFAGDVPMRSVVSRGVRSLTGATTESEYYVTEAVHHRPGDPAYMFRGDDPYHLIRRIRRGVSGVSVTAHELMQRYGQPNLIGLRGPGEDGFRLYPPHPLSLNLNGFLFLEGRRSSMPDDLTNFNLDLLDIDGTACIEDMENTMKELSGQLREEAILGAVMFSCNGRGPGAGAMIAEAMSDAKRFAKEFPRVPCLGFYAGGEIGPEAVVGSSSVFRQGRATVQGFTCVLALFIVPIRDLSGMDVNDSDDNVEAFFNQRFGVP